MILHKPHWLFDTVTGCAQCTASPSKHLHHFEAFIVRTKFIFCITIRRCIFNLLFFAPNLNSSDNFFLLKN